MKGKGQGWHGEKKRHSESAQKTSREAKLKYTLRQPMSMEVSSSEITAFLDGETNALILAGEPLALRVGEFVFITMKKAPHELAELYRGLQERNVPYSGGSVELAFKDGRVVVKNVDGEIKRVRDRLAGKTISNLSRKMYMVILDALKMSKGKDFTLEDSRRIGDRIGVDWSQVYLNQLTMGLNVEMEHSDVTGADEETTARIALAHLRERPDYYTMLLSLEAEKRGKST